LFLKFRDDFMQKRLVDWANEGGVWVGGEQVWNVDIYGWVG
jgi:hypothetical protein